MQESTSDLFPHITNVGGARNRGVELSIDAPRPGCFAAKLNGFSSNEDHATPDLGGCQG
ncbi:MAG: hypothetical protein ACT4QA_18035 [Panacagrimonas sp.]